MAVPGASSVKTLACLHSRVLIPWPSCLPWFTTKPLKETSMAPKRRPLARCPTSEKSSSRHLSKPTPSRKQRLHAKQVKQLESALVMVLWVPWLKWEPSSEPPFGKQPKIRPPCLISWLSKLHHWVSWAKSAVVWRSVFRQLLEPYRLWLQPRWVRLR